MQFLIRFLPKWLGVNYLLSLPMLCLTVGIVKLFEQWYQVRKRIVDFWQIYTPLPWDKFGSFSLLRFYTSFCFWSKQNQTISKQCKVQKHQQITRLWNLLIFYCCKTVIYQLKMLVSHVLAQWTPTSSWSFGIIVYSWCEAWYFW